MSDKTMEQKMYRWIRLVIAIVVIGAVSGMHGVSAQSGRGKQPAPPPKPKQTLPKPTVLGIPEGGKLKRQDMDGATSRFLLQNGLRVIIRERHSAPLAAVNISVKAGPVDESDEMAGTSRVVRQMILRGSGNYTGSKIDRAVARMGGTLTSRTDSDLTSFDLVAPAESYNLMIELLAGLIVNPDLKAEEIGPAARAAALESAIEDDSPAIASIDRFFATAFTANRLKRGRIFMADPASFSLERIQEFHRRYYHPENTVITITGDIFSLQALGQAQLNFGNYKKYAPPTAKPAKAPAKKEVPPEQVEETAAPVEPFSPNPAEPAQESLRYGNDRNDTGYSIVTIGYRGPDLTMDKSGKPEPGSLKDLATMRVLAATLGLGRGSRLNQGLTEGFASRDKLSVTVDGVAEYRMLPGAGMLIAQLTVEPDRIDRAEAEYFREIERFKRELISEGELRRAIVMLEKRHFDRISKVETEAATLSFHELHFGDYRLFDSMPERLGQVTAQDVQQAATKYLTLGNTTVHEYEPLTARPRTFTPEKYAELVVTFAGTAAQPVKPEEVKPAVALKVFEQGAPRRESSEGRNVIIASVPQPIKDFSVLRGPRAFVREDKTLPRLTVSVLFQGGRLIEDHTTSGITELMLRTMQKSTATRKADLVSHELESYGGDMIIVNEPDYFGFTLDVLSRNAENAIRLLIDILENPFTDKDEVAREAAALLAIQREYRDDHQTRANDLVWASLYPNHPYSLPRYGLPEVVGGATAEKIEQWYAKTVRKQFPIVILVGDTDGSALVSRIFSEGLRRDELDRTLQIGLPRPIESAGEMADQRKHRTTTQEIGFRITSQMLTSPNDIHAIEMLGHLASAGSLADELRYRQSLTNSIDAGMDQRIAAGAFALSITSLPENEKIVRETVMGEMKRLAGEAVTDEEFEWARNATIGRDAIALQSHFFRALRYARAVIFGRDPKDIESQPDQVRSIRKADVKRLAESILKSGITGAGVVRGGK
ncbi:MAG: insulinase family protein [Acidobacteriota bacterium]|nr:MAG: insulinase family protein [Acidobacteriota bacterium]